MLRPFAIGAAVLCICSAAIAGAADEAEAAFAKFFPAFAAYNQNAVAAMFAPDGQFYGTLSPRLVTSAEGVQSYFNAALNRPDRVVVRARHLLAGVAFPPAIQNHAVDGGNAAGANHGDPGKPGP